MVNGFLDIFVNIFDTFDLPLGVLDNLWVTWLLHNIFQKFDESL